MRRKCGLWLLFIVAYATPFFLQCISFFTPSWVFKEGMRRGLFYQCPDKTDYTAKDCSMYMPDRATIGIEGTSLVLMLISLINTCCSLILYGPDEFDDFDNDDKEGCFYTSNAIVFYVCSIAFYPVTGILILSGCIRFGTLYPTQILGASFYCCAIAGCLQFLMIFVSCSDAICKKRGKEFVFKSFFERLYQDA